MRTLLFLCCTTLGATISTAQTLTGAANNMLPGDVFIVRSGSGAPPGPAGSVNWNYAGLTANDAPVTLSFEAPSTSPFASDFPTATVRIGDSFLRGDATGLFSLGYGDDIGPMIYDDPLKQFAYPFSFGSSWTDAFNGADDNGYSESGSTSGSADGAGALIMPYGTISNVLRLHVLSSRVYNYNGDVFTVEEDAYYYMKPGVHFPLLVADPSGEDVSWLDQSSVGVVDLLAHDIGVDVYPDPAADLTTVVYSGTGQRLQLSLVDVAGAVVLERTLNSAIGVQREGLDVSGLAPGLYTVRITDTQGGQGVRRLVVQ